MPHAYRDSTFRPRYRGPVLALAIAAALGAALAGCGGEEDEALGETRARRLTGGTGLKEFPCFSPDGRTIAYTVSTAEREYDHSVRVVPAAGGESRELTGNDVPQVCLSWAADGRGLYTLNVWDLSLRLVGLDGAVLARYPYDGVSEPVAVAPAGDEFLYRRGNNGNFDLGIRPVGKSGLMLLAETAEWEVDGCFGPGDGVTAVRRPTGWAEESGIAVWNRKTREYVPVPLPGDRNIDPAWDAVGQYLAYASDESGDFDIWVHDRDSRRTLRVTGGPGDDRFPAWSPDGRRLAFCRWMVVSHVFVRDMASGEDRELTAGRSRDRFPVVSPDGAWIVFARTQTPVDLPRDPELCLVSSAGGPIHRLETEGLRLRLERDGICWSPDSEEIAFPADDGSGNVDVYRISRRGGVPARVTIRRGADVDPAWSPDGTYIAYARGGDEEGESGIWVIPSTGGVPVRVSSSSGVHGAVVWAPDSDRMVHYSYVNSSTAGTELWISSRSAPGRSRLLLSDGRIDIPLAWSRDGRTVFFRREEVEATTVWAFSAQGSEPVRIGEDVRGEGEAADLLRLNEAGRRYADQLFPGGIQAYAEGEDVGDIYVIEIADLLRTRF